MVLRIDGIALLLLGIAVSTFCIWGLTITQSMAEQFSMASLAQGVEFDAPSWSYHWRLYGVIILCIGAAVTVAGAVVVRKKVWGFLLFAATAAFTAIFPWVYVQLGLAKYGFERATLSDTCAYGLLALLATIAFFVGRQNRAGT